MMLTLRRHLNALMALMLLTAVALQPAIAQDTPPASEDAEDTALREQSIYVPYEKLWKVFEKEGRGVFLPYERFMQLWQDAEKRHIKPMPDKAPIGTLITDVSGTVKVGKDVINVSATIGIELLQKGWHEVNIGLGDTALTRARIGDAQARLLRRADGAYALLVQKSGDAEETLTLTVDFAKSYTKAPGRNSVSFRCPPAPVSRWDVHIADTGVDVDIRPMLATTEVPPEDENASGTHVLAFVGAAPSVSIEWTPKSTGAKGLQALAHVQADHQVSIHEGLMRTRVDLTFDISRAEAAQLVVDVPAGQKIVNVFDPNVREWSVAETEGLQRVTALLFEPVKGRQALVLELEQIDNTQMKAIPTVQAVDVSRQRGVVVVRLGDDLRGEATDRSGLLQVDAKDLPAAMRKTAWDFAYRYAALPIALAVRVDPIQPEIEAETLTRVHIAPDALKMVSHTVFDVQKSRVFELALDIPAGYTLESVTGFGGEQNVSPAQIDGFHLDEVSDGRQLLKINLTRRAQGKTGVALVLTRKLHHPELETPMRKDATIAVPVPQPVGDHVKRASGRLALFADASLRINLGEKSGLQSVTAAKINATYPRLGSTGGMRQGFEYANGLPSLNILAQRRAPHRVASQLFTMQIDSGVVKYEALMTYSIQYSGVKSLRIDVPTAAESQIHFEGKGLRHGPMNTASNDIAEGYSAWRIEGETDLIGQVNFWLQWEEKLTGLDIGKSVTLDVPRLMPRDIDRAYGQIVLAKAEAIDLAPGRDSEGLRPIDPRQDLSGNSALLRDQTAVRNAARAFEFHDDWTLSVRATRYEPRDVKATSIERGLIRMVVTRSGQTGVQAVYRMRSARQRLAVKLPGDVSFDAQPLRINGQAVSLEQGGAGEYFVPLANLSQDDVFQLEIRYVVNDQGLQIRPPEFPKEPAIQQVYVSVYVPKDLSFLGTRGPWTHEMVWTLDEFNAAPRGNRSADSLLSWISQGTSVRPSPNFATDGRHLLFSALKPVGGEDGALRIVTTKRWVLQSLVLTAILAIGLFLLPAGWGRRCVVAGGALVAWVLLAVFLPSFARAVVSNAAVGAGLVIAILWVLWFLLVTLPRSDAWKERQEERAAQKQRRIDERIARAAAETPPTPPPQNTPANEGGEDHA